VLSSRRRFYLFINFFTTLFEFKERPRDDDNTLRTLVTQSRQLKKTRSGVTYVTSYRRTVCVLFFSRLLLYYYVMMEHNGKLICRLSTAAHFERRKNRFLRRSCKGARVCGVRLSGPKTPKESIAHLKYNTPSTYEIFR